MHYGYVSIREENLGHFILSLLMHPDMVPSLAFVSWLENICEEDGVLTKLLVDAGAVLYVLTNTPQALMGGETDSESFPFSSIHLSSLLLM